MNRRGLLLVLIAVLLVAVAYAVVASPRQERIAPLPGKTAAAAARGAKDADRREAAPRLRLELLARGGEPFPGAGRDLFGALYPPPPPPVQTPPPPPPPARAAVEPLPPTPPPPPAPAMLRQELARFRYLGFLQKNGDKTVFLSSGQEVFVVKQGSRFGEREQFLVTDLSAERLVIRQREESSPLIVSLVEDQPLAPAPDIRAAPHRGTVARSITPPPVFRPGGRPAAEINSAVAEDAFTVEEVRE